MLEEKVLELLLGSLDLGDHGVVGPIAHLPQHLVLLYGHGDLNLQFTPLALVQDGLLQIRVNPHI